MWCVCFFSSVPQSVISPRGGHSNSRNDRPAQVEIEYSLRTPPPPRQRRDAARHPKGGKVRRKANDCNDALIIIWKHGHKHGRAQQQQKMAVRFDSLLASPGEELFELCLARKNKVETNKKKIPNRHCLNVFSFFRWKQ